MTESNFSRRNMLKNAALVGGAVTTAILAEKASAQSSTPFIIVNKFTDLTYTLPTSAGQIARIKGHTIDGAGGGDFISKAGQTNNDGGTQINVQNNQFYWKRTSNFINFEDFGAHPDNADNTANIQNAINAMSVTGGTIYVSPGIYKHSSTIVLKSRVSIAGAGSSPDGSTGSVFLYTGVSDGWQINNPINQQTDVNILISSVTFKALNIGITRGCFADTASVQLYFDQCAFIFNSAGCGLIFDQTETSTAERCTFFTPNSFGNGACVWIVNGNSRTAGAANGYTNQLSFTSNQFNAASSTARGIVNEGGLNHRFIGNNFNGGSAAFEGAALNGCTISENEIEGITSRAIILNRGKYNLGSSGVVISGNYFVTGDKLAIDIASYTCETFEYSNNTISKNSPGSPESILEDSCTHITAYGNFTREGGGPAFNNISNATPNTYLDASLYGEANPGNNSTYSNRKITWDRNGRTVAVSGEISLTQLDSTMSGYLKMTCLPYKATNIATITIAMHGFLKLGAGYTNIAAVTIPGTKDVYLYKYGANVNFAKMTPADINSSFNILISGIYLCNNIG